MIRPSAALLCAAFLPLLLAGGSSASTIADRLKGVGERAEKGELVEALEGLKDAELLLWRAMPQMAARKAVLVTAEPAYFGSYSARPDSRYRPGEAVLLYVEPVGYAIVEADGLFRFDLTADFTLLDDSGQVLGGQRDFGRWQMSSHRPVTEFMMYFTYDFSGLPAGAYTVETVVRDANSAKTLELSTPFSVVPPEGGSPWPQPPEPTVPR